MKLEELSNIRLLEMNDRERISFIEGLRSRRSIHLNEEPKKSAVKVKVKKEKKETAKKPRKKRQSKNNLIALEILKRAGISMEDICKK